MNFQSGSVYMLMGEVIAKQAMHEALHGKVKAKKQSRIKTMFKKISK